MNSRTLNSRTLLMFINFSPFLAIFDQFCCFQPIFDHFLLIRAVLKFAHFDCAKISTARILIHLRYLKYKFKTYPNTHQIICLKLFYYYSFQILMIQKQLGSLLASIRQMGVPAIRWSIFRWPGNSCDIKLSMLPIPLATNVKRVQETMLQIKK